MKRLFVKPKALSATALVTVMLAGCGAEAPPLAPPESRPVKIYQVSGGAGSAVRDFPARVDAAQRADLSFRVAGQLQEILVREGDLVEQGQLVARLDPTDFSIVLEDRQATFDNAERNFERGKQLVSEGAISRTDYDTMEANYRTATAALTAAKKDVEYTELRAPFPGRIAQRLVENFEEVLAKQSVFFLTNINQLDVLIDMPESMVRKVRGGNDSIDNTRDAADGDPSLFNAWVSFQDRPGVSFPLRIKELATRADEQTQTYRVTFTMSAPKDFTVLPGMTAQVEVDFSQVLATDTSKWVPTRAVQADSGLKARVWVLDGDSMTVNSQPVEIGRMSGSLVEVMSGLDGGEEIVAVGAPYLAEGMKVTRMAQSEQAVPRADDPA
ncbi:MAG: efflux RND transporter periplasmic adaptor subunit [Pseudomonadota bacterium]